MELYSCEQYVLRELENIQNELSLCKKKIEELEPFEYKTKDLEAYIEKQNEFIEALKKKILHDAYKNSSAWFDSDCFEDYRFKIESKDALLKIGITKEEMEEYVKMRLEEEKQNEHE